MVNDGDYAQLKKSVQGWNDWREKNLIINPDLSGADLREADLREANFKGADLSGADLREANFKGADLSGADLREANLSGADLSHAYLSGADLREANLKRAILNGAILHRLDFNRFDLYGADLRGANLRGAELIMADLRGANLSGANLSEAFLVDVKLGNTNLSRANLNAAWLNNVDISGANLNDIDIEEADKYGLELSRPNLSGANLSNVVLVNANIKYANLSGLDFSSADLTEADLSYSNLSEVNLSGAKLIRTQALRTNFTAANFTGICLEDWHINSDTKLDNIECHYVYLKSNEQERRPSSGEFAQGEFTKLFQKALETVDLIFTDGIDWKAFLFSFQELQAEYGEENLSVQAIEKKTGSAFVIRLEVPPGANKAEIEHQAKASYEIQLKALEARHHAELQAKDEQIVIHRQHNATLENIIYKLADRPIQNINSSIANADSKSMSESYQSKYDQRNSNNQFLDTAQAGSKPSFNQYNYTPQQRQNLVEAAKEIEALLQYLQQSYPTTTTSEKMSVVAKAVDEIERNPTLKARVIGALKAGGTEALKELIDNPLINILLASIEGWQEAE